MSKFLPSLVILSGLSLPALADFEIVKEAAESSQTIQDAQLDVNNTPAAEEEMAPLPLEIPKDASLPPIENEPMVQTTPQTALPAPSADENILRVSHKDLQKRIERATAAFSQKLDQKNRDDLNKALSASIIFDQEIKIEGPIIEQPKEILKDTPKVFVERKDRVEVKEKKSQKKVEVQKLSDEAQNPAVAKVKARISELNQKLSNPKLQWPEFEKLLNERRNLERQLKAESLSASSGKSIKSN